MKIVQRKARRLNELALFAGAGGGILASRLLGWRTVCAVEIDPYCREVLLRRQEEWHLEPFPIWDDVRTFDGRPWSGCVDVVSAGFPCQPFSVAGKPAGKDDDRNLWPETIRIIREMEPRFAFLENVPGLLCPIQDKETGETQASYFGTVLGDLAESGYDARWRVLSAAEVGAPHKRDRLWIVWHSTELQQYGGDDQSGSGQTQIPQLGNTSCSNYVADAASQGEESAQQPRQGDGPQRRGETGDIPDPEVPDGRRPSDTQEQRRRTTQARGSSGGWWSAEPDVGRVAHGVAYRVDRLRALGNGQVPAVARAAWELLTQ